MASISFSSLIFQHIPHTFSFQPRGCSFKSWAGHVPFFGKIFDHAVASAGTPLSSFLNKLMSAQAWVQCQSTPSGRVPWAPSRGQCPLASSYRPSLSTAASLGLLWIIALLPHYSLNSGRVGGLSLFTIIWLAPKTVHNTFVEWMSAREVNNWMSLQKWYGMCE